ncbi:MAG: hypothetical protein OXC07_01585 [Kistimonas sp.]|nr:hypothetical protein [Kistimonas sp.]
MGAVMHFWMVRAEKGFIAVLGTAGIQLFLALRRQRVQCRVPPLELFLAGGTRAGKAVRGSCTRSGTRLPSGSAPALRRTALRQADALLCVGAVEGRPDPCVISEPDGFP